MDVIQILTTIKGKVLDAANFEILKKTYELQNDNIEQLKNNNEALKESNGLLKEKTSGLERDYNNLKVRVKSLEDELRMIKSADSSQKLSEFAEAILRKCIKDDKSEFLDDRMVASFPFSKMQAEAGLDELIKHKLVVQTSVSFMNVGAGFSLTPEGKKLALKIASK